MISGKQLKAAIKGAGYTIENAAKSLGISRQTLHNHLNKAELEYFFVKNAIDTLELKLKLEDEPLTLHEAAILYRNAKDDLVESLKETIKSQAEIIEMQRQRIAQLETPVSGKLKQRSA